MKYEDKGHLNRKATRAISSRASRLFYSALKDIDYTYLLIYQKRNNLNCYVEIFFKLIGDIKSLVIEKPMGKFMTDTN